MSPLCNMVMRIKISDVHLSVWIKGCVLNSEQVTRILLITFPK